LDDGHRRPPDKFGGRPLLSAISVFAVSNSGDFDRVVDIVIEEDPMIATAEPEKPQRDVSAASRLRCDWPGNGLRNVCQALRRRRLHPNDEVHQKAWMKVHQKCRI
jgi:hypothetical protein